jgi:hypothetical protein
VHRTLGAIFTCAWHTVRPSLPGKPGDSWIGNAMRQQHPFSEVSPSCLSSVSSCPSCPIFLLLQPFSSVSPSPRRYSSISGSLSGLSGAACWIITVFGGPDLITELLPLRNSSPRKGLSPASQPACFSFHSTPPKFAYRLHLAAERACLALCLIIATSSKEGGGGETASRESLRTLEETRSWRGLRAYSLTQLGTSASLP